MSTEWSEALLVLDATFRLPPSGPIATLVSPEAVNAALGREPDDERTERALYDLKRTGYIDGLDSDQRLAPAAFELTEKGFQAVGGWPSAAGSESLFNRLLAEIDERLETAVTPEERTRWERLRAGLVGIGHDVFTALMTAVADRATRGI